MNKKYKISLILVLVIGLGCWIGNSVFNYMTYSSLPEINLCGIEKEGHYSGLVECSIKSDNGYKIAEMVVFLDGKEFNLRNSKRVGSKNFSIPFKLDTFNLENGQHDIQIEAIDASYNRNKSVEKWNFYIDNNPLKAAILQSEYKVDQGRTVHAKIQTNKNLESAKVKFLEKVYDCYPESNYSNVYECFIPIDCEQLPDEYMMDFDLQDHVKNNVKLSSKVVVNAFNFPRQKRFINTHGKLDEEKEISMSEKILEEALEKWTQDSPNKKLWTGNFEVPLDLKKIATSFGEVRVTPEKGRYLHKAVDIINLPKSVVWAAQDGKVIIKDRYLMTGNTVVIDHGLGVTTLYCHLEDFTNIEVGDYVKKGNPIGRMGMTGYADGYHLHWELRVNNTPVDPFEWTKKTF